MSEKHITTEISCCGT